jgi:hypothetical protein
LAGSFFNLSPFTLYDAISILLSALAFFFSIYTFKKSWELNTYNDLDTLYNHTLEIPLLSHHPEFRDPDKTHRYKEAFSDRNLLAYETYAYIVWNVCETVYDTRREDKTWYPIVDAERKLHSSWLFSQENSDKFKPEFIHFMKNDFEEALQKVEQRSRNNIHALEMKRLHGKIASSKDK